MTISMYQSSVPVFIRNLNNLSEILAKGASFCRSKNIDDSVLLNYRMAADMFPLVRQVQIVSDATKSCAARLAEVEMPSFEDKEVTFSDLQERIVKTIKFLETIKPEQIDGKEELKISYVQHGKERNFIGLPYLLNWGLPNLYFHITATYLILRHNGVEIGKKDYLG